MKSGVIKTHGARLPLPDNAPNLTLGEGNTPLLPLTLGGEYGIKLHAKFEGANPTGSFKDRGMVVAVAAAIAKGARAVLCASTGNTSASAAAYAARAGLVCAVLLPEGKVAAGKIAQAVIHGAKIIRVRGNFDDAMSAVRFFEDKGEVAVVNSINPMRLQGQKTAAFEVCRQLGDAPDYHALPVGNAGNITAHWIGYAELCGISYKECAHCSGDCQFTNTNPESKAPKMLGYQAEGAAPFLTGKPVQNPETIATAIRIGNPQSFNAAKAALKQSGGRISAVSDDEILKTQQTLAQIEGIFCEPASAASVAGVLKDAAAGKFEKGARIVCTLTGHGLKDPDIVGEAKVIAPAPGGESLRAAIGEVIGGGK